MNSFIQSQFSYNPLTWMFHGRKANNRINHIHERALRIVYDDQKSSFQKLLQKDNSCCIHYRNIQTFAIELFKVKNNMSNQIMIEILELRDITYNLRNQTDFSSVGINTNAYGTNSLRSLAAKVWNITPLYMKNLNTVKAFKSEIRKWVPVQCNCKLCQTFIANVGYIDKVTNGY